MDEEEGGFRYGGTKGGLCGCFAALFFAWAAGMPFLFVWAWSGAHCEPVPQCHQEAELGALAPIAVVLALAALLGFAVRALVIWWMQRRADPASARLPPVWALVVAVSLLVAALVALDAMGWLG